MKKENDEDGEKNEEGEEENKEEEQNKEGEEKKDQVNDENKILDYKEGDDLTNFSNEMLPSYRYVSPVTLFHTGHNYL